MNIAVLIGIMIAIVGVSLIPAITSATSQVTTTNGYDSSVASLANILPIVFIAVIVLCAAAYMSGSIGGSDEKKKERRAKVIKVIKNPMELIKQVEKQSSKYGEYINNLDDLLGIKTIVSNVYDGLSLNSDNSLYISNAYDWYLSDKHPDQQIFKIIGLNKNDAVNNKVYILGNVGSKPFLRRIDESFIEKPATVEMLNEANVK